MRAYLCKYPGCTHIVDTPRTYCKQHEALGQAADARKADAPRPQWAGKVFGQESEAMMRKRIG